MLMRDVSLAPDKPNDAVPGTTRKGKLPAPPAPCRRALLICNGRFKYMPHFQLPGVRKDARHLGAALADPDRARFQVTTMVDKGLWEVRRAIARVCADSRQDDTLLIYYSGTSIQDKEQALCLPVADSDSELIAATSIEAEFLLAQMRTSACQRFVVIIDGCHSGAFFRNSRGIPDGLIAITSCGTDEYSTDTPEGGAFTQSLLRALTDPKADLDRDGNISVEEAYDYICGDLASRGEKNHPQKWIWNLPRPIFLVESTLQVFVSYARADAGTVDVVTPILQRHGIKIWRDVEGIAGGAKWRDSIAKALTKSAAVLLLMSKDSFGSKWVRRELEFADGKDLPIVPVATQNITAPDWFTLQFGGVQQQVINLKDLEASCLDLARTVRGVVAEAGQTSRPRLA
jgi:hypothetical protein